MIATFTNDETTQDILVVTNDVQEIARRLEAKIAGVEKAADAEARRIGEALARAFSAVRAPRAHTA